MLKQVRTFAGIARSLKIYYGNRTHLNKMAEFYRDFVNPGDLVFDIGAHVGDRILAFRRLKCRVIAAEPQPALFHTLRLIYGRNANVHLLQVAVSDAPGTIALNINTANPTVSSASDEFVRLAQAGAIGWDGQVWDNRIIVKATTLDDLIAIHGPPAFVKIDVEGLEDKVLAGLARPLKALSFEFTTHEKQVALACLKRLRALGPYGFNACLGESFEQAFSGWVSSEEMSSWIESLPAEANSGDVYCKRMDQDKVV